ncbi:unnamed protein product [Bursaphelenchus okinawaensis]|uniref:Uncharacterized protein n=1 Tax=Bursaphelenchus okinawaensis TaxID=465554 RepID=A0A811JUI8_9BILA|nr:unnamed protein product [Bursaphelenchus okinawaensis]CAG9083872.1 unnamed protein product [Bursaphelenchus okinawaensis]
MFQLEFIQQRIAAASKLMFYQKMDFTFYREDVVLEDEIWGIKKQSRTDLMNYFGTLSVTCKVLFPSVELEPLNIIPLLDDGTVRFRWRMKYLHWYQVLNVKNFNPEIREKNCNWYDGNATFHVDGNGKVFKLKITKVTPDDSYLQNTKRIAQKFANISTNQTTSFSSKQ